MLHPRVSMLCAPVLLMLASGCYVQTTPARTRYSSSPPPPPPVQATTVAPAAPATNWVRLGERTVEGASDYDSIAVGSAEGRFAAIEFRVDRNAIDMYDVVVVFADGSRYSPNTRLRFNPGTTSQYIDLPGNRRTIQRVDFHYGNVNRGGRARVELWAR